MEANDTVEALQARYERRLDRERRARHAAEELLEAKALELYTANQRLRDLAGNLEQRVSERTRELALAERRASALAERDQLTGIANRVLFTRRVEEAIRNSAAAPSGFALVLLDLDHFQHVNDGFGHDAGDALLRHVAARIAAAVSPSDCVARLGGDEFAMLLAGTTEPADLAARAERMIAILREPFRHCGHLMETSCSIGVAVFPDHGQTGADLQRFADLALHKAKAAGRATFAIFDDQLRRDNDDRHAIGSELRLAIGSGAVQPWFQPIVDAHTFRPMGVEALARWRHPVRGLLSPAQFLTVAEERGLVNDLFAAMLRTSCRVTRDCIRDGSIGFASVNVSPNQIHAGCLVTTIRSVLDEEDFPAAALTVEITEDVLLNDLGHAREQLESVAELGVRVALDDFGIGYSNIGYLRRLPLHQIKLDRILTSDVADDPKARAILAAIVEIARTLELAVVAEGVETAPQAEWLRRLGCHKLQGYRFGKAMNGDALRAYLAAATPDVPGSRRAVEA